MRLGLRDIDWSQAGSQLARCGDDEQAEFFKAFVKECKSWGTNHQVELQLAGVNRRLTTDEKQTIGMIGYDNE
jgi:hypothetical protein